MIRLYLILCFAFMILLPHNIHAAAQKLPNILDLLPYDFTQEQTDQVKQYLAEDNHDQALQIVLNHIEKPLNSVTRFIGRDISFFEKRYYQSLFDPNASYDAVISTRLTSIIFSSSFNIPQAIHDNHAWYPDLFKISTALTNDISTELNIQLPNYYHLGFFDKAVKAADLLLNYSNSTQAMRHRNQGTKILSLMHLGEFTKAHDIFEKFSQTGDDRQKAVFIESFILKYAAILKQTGHPKKSQKICQKHLPQHDSNLSWLSLKRSYRYSLCAYGPNHTKTQFFWNKMHANEYQDDYFFLFEKFKHPEDKLLPITSLKPTIRLMTLLSLMHHQQYPDLFPEQIKIAQKRLAELGPDRYFGNFKDLN